MSEQRYYKYPCDNCKHDGQDCPIPETLYSGAIDHLNSFRQIIAITGCKHLLTENPHAPTIQETANALVELDIMFPVNTKFYANGDLHGGWELNPDPLFKLKKAIEANPQFTEEPEAEVIEVVILAIKNALRKGAL
jgi:hypothetical protein